MKEVKTVRELIEILSTLDPDAVPLTFDEGYLPICNIEVGEIELDPQNETSYQYFKWVNDGTINRYPTVPAVVLGYD